MIEINGEDDNKGQADDRRGCLDICYTFIVVLIVFMAAAWLLENLRPAP